MTTLDTVSIGQQVTIRRFMDTEMSLLAMRFGLNEGVVVELCAKPPGGPLVLRKGSLEVALGRKLCQKIEVSMI